MKTIRQSCRHRCKHCHKFNSYRHQVLKFDDSIEISQVLFHFSEMLSKMAEDLE